MSSTMNPDKKQPQPIEVSNRSLQPLRRLTTFSRAISYVRTLDEILALTSQSITEVLGIDQAAIILDDDEEDAYRLRMAMGFEPDPVTPVMTLAAMQSQLVVWMGDNNCAVPLLSGSDMLGLLCVAWPDDDPVDEQRQWMLTTFADQLAVAIANVYRRQDAQENHHELNVTRQREQSHQNALNTLSHDVRSPLNSIMLQLELLNGEMLGPLSRDQQEALQIIRTNAEEITELATMVMETGRVLAGQETVKLVPVTVKDIVLQSVKRFEPQLRAKEIELSLDIRSELLLQADPQWLTRIIGNLLDNAIKYSPTAGRVRIVSQTSDLSALASLIVSDGGPGIPAEAAETIFEPYTRSPNTMHQVAGIGLGLSLARAMAQRMGGELVLDTNVPVGACFILRLPLST